MPKLPGVRHQDAVRVFENHVHRRYQAHHSANPIDPYTMGAIGRDAGLTPGEFPRLLSDLQVQSFGGQGKGGRDGAVYSCRNAFMLVAN